MMEKHSRYLFGNLAIGREGSMLMDIHLRQRTFLPIAMFGKLISLLTTFYLGSFKVTVSMFILMRTYFRRMLFFSTCTMYEILIMLEILQWVVLQAWLTKNHVEEMLTLPRTALQRWVYLSDESHVHSPLYPQYKGHWQNILLFYSSIRKVLFNVPPHLYSDNFVSPYLYFRTVQLDDDIPAP